MKHIANVIMVMGALLIVSALGLTVFCIYDEMRASESVDSVREYLVHEIPDYSQVVTIPSSKEETDTDFQNRKIPIYELNPSVKMASVSVNKNDYIGIIRVPSINIELPVISEWSYPNLRYAPCCYSGSAYEGDFVICAHNYTDHFGNIQSISVGDDIIFTDIGGNNFFYKTECIDILDPTDIEEMTSDEYDLTLFTCTFTGQARVAVRCTKFDSEAE